MSESLQVLEVEARLLGGRGGSRRGEGMRPALRKGAGHQSLLGDSAGVI